MWRLLVYSFSVQSSVQLQMPLDTITESCCVLVLQFHSELRHLPFIVGRESHDLMVITFVMGLGGMAIGAGIPLTVQFDLSVCVWQEKSRCLADN